MSHGVGLRAVALCAAAVAAACASGRSGVSGGVTASGSADGDGFEITIGPARERAVRELDRSQVPELGPITGVDIPEADTFSLSNGIEVVFVRRSRSGLVGVEVLVRGGASTLAEHEAGLATLTADLLDEGAGSLDAPALAEAIEAIGARLSTSAGFDAYHIRASVPAARTERLIEIVSDVTLRPRFEQTDVDRVLALRKARALQRKDDPSNLADDAFYSVVFGADPYGSPLIGTAETLASFGKPNVEDAYAGHFAPQRSTIFVVGNTSRDELEPVLERQFGGWAVDGALRPFRAPLTSEGHPPHIYLVDKPGAAQSEIRVGRIGRTPRDPDKSALDVMNTILGGAFTSRLNSKLREEKGFTYGAFSIFADNVRTGSFSAETAVHTPVTAEAVVDILAEFERLRTEPVPEAELERAKRYLALRLPSRFETTSQILSAVSGLALHSLTLAWYDDYVDRITAVTAADVGRVADRYLDTAQVAVVIAGDREAIEGPLSELGWDVVVLGGSDNP